MSPKISDFDAVWIIKESKHILKNKSTIIWFSTDAIRELLKYLDTTGRSGVRIYSGKYPKHPDFSRVNGKHDYRGEKTIVLVPTIEESGTHRDEIPEDKIVEYVRAIENGEFPQRIAFNHGELCPPNCGGNTIDANT